MRPFRGGGQPIVMLGRHQHELASAMPRNLDRLPLGLMLGLAEFALELQGGDLGHRGILD
jgi:hypothetical protein